LPVTDKKLTTAGTDYYKHKTWKQFNQICESCIIFCSS